MCVDVFVGVSVVVGGVGVSEWVVGARVTVGFCLESTFNLVV